jgi:hypothetical protein
MKRHRFVQKASLKARLGQEMQQLREEAESFPPGHKRDSLLGRGRQKEMTDLAGWLISRGLQK